MATIPELTGSTYFPAEGQTFRAYIDELLKAKPKFSGLFTQDSTVKPVQTTPATAQPPSQPTSSSAPFGYNADGSRRDTPQTNLTDEQWAAVKALRDEQGWGNAFDANSLKAAGIGLMGMLGGPMGLLGAVNKAMPYGNAAMAALRDYMGQGSGQQWAGVSDIGSPYAAQAVESPSFNTAALTNPTITGGLLSQFAPEVNQAIMDPRDAMVAAPVATSYPVASPSYESAYQAVTSGYAPIQSYTDSSGNTGTLSLSSYTPTYTGSSEGE